MVRAVFLDRDGVINRKAPEGEYVTSWAGFEFLPGAMDGLKLLAGAPVKIIIQSRKPRPKMPTAHQNALTSPWTCAAAPSPLTWTWVAT